MTETDPIFRPPPEHIQQIHRQVELIKKLSDRVIGIGPFGLGLDGLLAWIPGAGLVYGLGAGALLLVNAVRAKASASTMLRMAAYLAIDNATDTVPVVGWAVDTLFPGHLMAANALQKDMVAKHGPMEPPKLKSVGKGRARASTSAGAGASVGAGSDTDFRLETGGRVRRGGSWAAWAIGLIVVIGLAVACFILAGGALVRAVGEAWTGLVAR